jgi:sugar/nucleoside kinase (ribokinase family)
MDTKNVVAVGDICMDIKPQPLSDFSLGDRQFRVDDLKISVGGNSANFCLGTAGLGLKTTLIACLGKDPISRWLQNTMRNHGVNCKITYVENVIAGITVGITHTDGTRQMITYNGSNLEFSPIHVNLKDIKNAQHLHRSGFWWCPKFFGKGTARILKFAQNNMIETSLDIATDPYGWRKERREKVYDILPYVDIFFGNDTEITQLAQKNDIKSASKTIIEYGVNIVVAHLGEKGSAVFTKNDFVKAGAYKITIKNPIGTGDIYNAGFVYGRLNKWSLQKCAQFGNACAAYYLERLEEPYPTFEKVIKRFQMKGYGVYTHSSYRQVYKRKVCM